ncbi:retinol dehydrogenase 12-like [Ischnura elegans]|uniref:retinol dehydrogenase 12-like n=1 Tax=Ischnura elegans TaxID=197161 RepID=UPI001ED87DEC|nr:retinol dehydrogenase 12-like [Ischnura elegans]
MGLLGYLMRNCNSKERLDGKVAVITGCNTGIGFETAKSLALRGCRVVMACRDLEKAHNAAEGIKQIVRDRREKNNQKVMKDKVNNDIMNNEENEDSIVAVYHLDLSSLKSVRKCAEAILLAEPKINLLINNAGVMACPRKLTEDGYEWQFAVNHLGHFLFTLLLLERICESPGARIVNLASLAHFWGSIHFDDLNLERRYSPTGAYFRSKLANVLFTKDLAQRLKGTGVTTYAVHPGIVATEMSRHFSNTLIPGMTWVCQKLGPYFAQNCAQGCQTTLYCAIDERAANENGLYYSNCKPVSPSDKAKDPELARRLWDVSLKLVGIEEDPSRDLARRMQNASITRL